MINYYEFRWTSPEETPFVGIVVDYDESVDFNRFCDDAYKEIPGSERLKANIIIFRLPVARNFSNKVIEGICSHSEPAGVPDEESLESSIRASIAEDGSFLNVRFMYVPVHFLFSDDYNIYLSDACNADRVGSSVSVLTPGAKSALIEHLRQIELRLFVERAPAIFGPVQGVPYLTPSGEEARIFLRVGNIQLRRTVLHAIFFWLLPNLRHTAAILTDTWSISSMAYNVSRLLARYRGRDAEIPRVDMLAEYHTTDETGLLLNLEVLRRFLRGPVAIPQGSEVLFLISAVFTGQLMKKIQTTMASEGLRLNGVRFVALYRLQDTTDEVCMCDLTDLQANVVISRDTSPPLPAGSQRMAVAAPKGLASDFGSPPEGAKTAEVPESPQTSGSLPKVADVSSARQAIVDVLVARSGKPTDGGILPRTPHHIVIDPGTYFPKLVSEIEIEVRERSVKNDKPVYDYYGSLGAFLVHHTQDDGDRGPRHHGVYIDTAAFIGSERFQRRLVGYLDHMERCPDLVLGPEHDRARQLVGLIVSRLKTRFGSDIRTLHHANLYIDETWPHPQDDAIRNAFAGLGESTEILVVDDAFVTGTRLYQYSQHLRYLPEGPYRGRVHFLVAVARPPSITAWTDAQKLLRYRRPKESGEQLVDNSVHAIEEIVLPNWEEDDCPWCIESGRLQDYDGIIAEMPELFKERWLLLRQNAEGFRDRLFLRAPSHPQVDLAGDGLFGKSPANQAAGFAAVAGGLQRLRTDLNRVPLGQHRYPLATVLKSVEYLSLVYTDSLLRASFFRAAHPDELCYHDPKNEEDRTKMARDDICNPSGKIYNIALELCWQVLEGKLPTELFRMIDETRFEQLGIATEVKFIKDVLATGYAIASLK